MKSHRFLVFLTVLANVLWLVHAGTLIVTVDNANLAPSAWEVHSVAAKNWDDYGLRILGINLVDVAAFLQATWYDVYAPELLEDGSYRFETKQGFLRNWLGAEMEENQLHFSYQEDVNTTYAGSSQLVPGSASFSVGINCFMVELELEGMSLSCDDSSVSWDSEETTTISVSMIQPST